MISRLIVMRKNFKSDNKADGYTAPHESPSDAAKHATQRMEEHTVHIYDGKGDPWPIGTDDKWMSNSKKKS